MFDPEFSYKDLMCRQLKNKRGIFQFAFSKKIDSVQKLMLGGGGYCEIIIIRGGLIFVDFVAQLNHEFKYQRTFSAQHYVKYLLEVKVVLIDIYVSGSK